jgi:hypothetical protein
MKITQIDAATGSNTEITVTKAEFIESVGQSAEIKPFADVIAEQQSLKASALAKLAALGLTEDEAKAIIG